MQFKILSVFILFFVLIVASCGDKETYVEIETDFGTMKAVLYNSTPLHRDNFIKLTKEGFYDDLLFHRVIQGFMIQGGDPDSRGAAPGASLGSGGPGYLIDAEIGSPHIKGTLAAARTSGGNPEKRSSGSQFYIVQGRQMTDNQLDNMEKQKGITYNEEQRRLYKEIGGSPMLDMDYTVFGEVVEGLDVIDKIAVVETDRQNRPATDVKMKVRILR